MDLGLKGRRALVTGSSSGIGAAIARMLAEEGADVIVHGRNEESAETVAADVRAAGVRGDVLIARLDESAEVDRLAAEALALGPVDILVNCAGAGASRRFFEVTLETWRKQIDFSLLYAVQLIHALVPPMRERGWGRVLNVSSAAGFKATAYGPEYSAAKLALHALSVSLAAELEGCGVTANTLASGLVLTPNTLDSIAMRGKSMGFTETGEALERRVTREVWRVPFGRAGTVEELASAACFLVSAQASYISGASLRVDGAASGFVN